MVSIRAMLCVVLSISGDPAKPSDLISNSVWLTFARCEIAISIGASAVFPASDPSSTPMLRELCSALDSRHLDALADAMWDEERFEIADVILRHKLPFETSIDWNESDWTDLFFRVDQFRQGMPSTAERFPFQQIWRDRIRQMKAENPGARAQKKIWWGRYSVRFILFRCWLGSAKLHKSKIVADGFFPQAGDGKLEAETWTTRNREAEILAKNRLQKLRDERNSGRRWVVEVETASAQQQ